MRSETKKERLDAIREIIAERAVESQEELLLMLSSKGFDVTQATLSRDMKILKIIKSPNIEGRYIYTLPVVNYQPNLPAGGAERSLGAVGFVSIEFSGNLGVIKTRPGYAMGIASDIDGLAGGVVLGTIAGDDTILLIPREGISRQSVIDALASFIPNIQNN